MLCLVHWLRLRVVEVPVHFQVGIEGATLLETDSTMDARSGCWRFILRQALSHVRHYQVYFWFLLLLLIQFVLFDVPHDCWHDQASNAEEWSSLLCADLDSLADFSWWDDSNQTVFFIHQNRWVLWEVVVRKNIIIREAFPQEDDALHFVDQSLTIVPVVQPLDQVWSHDERELMRALMHLRQLIHHVYGWNRGAIFHLNWVDFDWEIGREEFLHRQLGHFESLTSVRNMGFVRSLTTWHHPYLIEVQYVDCLWCHLYDHC